jgi:hypothetical protein
MGRLKEYFIENPFLLAHHPSCENFSNHTLDFRGLKLCMGCFVIYPTAIITLAAFFIISGHIVLNYMAAFMVALAMFTLNGIRKIVFRDRLAKNIQVAFRVVLGLSLSFMLISIWLARNPERNYLIGLFLAVAIGYNLLNSRRMMKTCKSCPQYPDFPKCEGLRNIK